MIDPSVHYILGRLDVLVEPCGRPGGDGNDWLVIVNREASARFASASAIAYCSSRVMAQELAHLLIGIEVTRGGPEERKGTAIWPDGRTGSAPGERERERESEPRNVRSEPS